MLLSLLLSSAWASAIYPGLLYTAAEMPCAPTCTVCHDTNVGGVGTVTREFGLAMMDRGLVGSDEEAFTTAFQALVADGVDSDDDGEPDVDELAGGGDPNPDGAPFCNVLTPEYGCFNTAQSPISGLAVAAGLLGAALARRRSG